MAPELALGKPKPDARSDLYSLGCGAVWLLAGRYLFDADTVMGMCVAHAREPAPPLEALAKQKLPAELSELVAQCLHKDREDRPSSARALLRSLEAMEGSNAWSTNQARNWWRRHLPERTTSTPPELDSVGDTMLVPVH